MQLAHVRHEMERSDADVDGVREAEVLYSMNKRKRWMYVQRLRDVESLSDNDRLIETRVSSKKWTN